MLEKNIERTSELKANEQSIHPTRTVTRSEKRSWTSVFLINKMEQSIKYSGTVWDSQDLQCLYRLHCSWLFNSLVHWFPHTLLFLRADKYGSLIYSFLLALLFIYINNYSSQGLFASLLSHSDKHWNLHA